MKKPLSILIILLLEAGINTNAQTEEKVDTAKYHLLKIADENPVFPGEEDALGKFLAMHLNPPKADMIEGSNGVVYANFTITKSGEIKDIRILKSPGSEYSEEVIRVIKLMPRWQPGKKYGEVVAVSYTIPVRFEKEKESKKKKGKK